MASKIAPSNASGTYRLVLNAALFQIGWLACVLGGNQWALTALAVMLICHWLFISQSQREWLLIVLLTGLGFSIDTLLALAGVLTIAESNSITLLGMLPIWLLCLWGLFVCTLAHSLRWLHHRLLLAALLGAIAGPMSYFSGAKLSLIELGTPLALSLLLMAALWAVLFPMLLLVMRRGVCATS